MTDGGYQPYPTVPPPTYPPAGRAPAPADPAGPAGEVAPTDERRRLLVEVVVLAVAFYLPNVFQVFRGIGDPSSVSTDISVVDLLTVLGTALAPGLIAVYLLWRDGRLRAAGFGRPRAGFVAGYGALGFVCCFLAVLTVGFAVVMFEVAIGHDPSPTEETTLHDEDAAVPLTFGSLAAAAALSLTAGLAEETVFRAYGTSRLEQAGLRRTAVWAPWALFTLLHLYQGPIALLVIGALAAVLTWLYRWKRSVYPVMVAHALYDMTVFTLVATGAAGFLR
jgi:membrane protease YdiL (CAAX protease family)